MKHNDISSEAKIAISLAYVLSIKYCIFSPETVNPILFRWAREGFPGLGVNDPELYYFNQGYLQSSLSPNKYTDIEKRYIEHHAPYITHWVNTIITYEDGV